MLALPNWTPSASLALLSWVSILVLGGCPERQPIANAEDATDAAVQDSPGPPPKIILLIGDGMGRGQRESASYFKTGTPDGLVLNTLPVQGTITTSSPSGITDSAASATAMATGSFTFNGRVGIDEDGLPVQNLVELAKSYGVATGIVTTTRISHATPASFTAHVDSRNQYQDIALQMAQLRPDVMLGGGRADFDARTDGQDLIAALRSVGYAFVTNASELSAAASGERQLLGLFASAHLPYVIDREEIPEDDTPTLRDMTLAALERLDQDPEGFFLMVEGGRIDHASHANLRDEVVGETLAFDETIAAVMEWSNTRSDVTILVTADHETGGLQVNSPTLAGQAPDLSWRWGNHTNASVASFGRGPGTEVFHAATRDHRWTHAVLAGLIVGESFMPPAVLSPNGSLEDVVGPSVGQQRPNPNDPATRLTRLSMTATDRGLGVGLEGLYRWDQGAVVVLLDIDYGLATGLRTLDPVNDLTGGADTFLSRIRLPVPPDNGFGADMVFISQKGLSSVYSSDSAGLRGLRAPYGEIEELQVIQSASNFSDNARSSGDATIVESNRGLELMIRWQDLYPGRTTPPPGTEIAAWAVHVNDSGLATNQSLPPWLDEAATMAPRPLVIQLP